MNVPQYVKHDVTVQKVQHGTYAATCTCGINATTGNKLSAIGKVIIQHDKKDRTNVMQVTY